MVPGERPARVLRRSRGHRWRLGGRRARRARDHGRRARGSGRRSSRAAPARDGARRAGVAPRWGAGLVARRQAPGDRQPAAARSHLQRQSRAQHRRAAAAVRRRRRVPPVARRRAAPRRLRRARDRDAGAQGQSAARGLRSCLGNAPASLLHDRAVRHVVAGPQREVPAAGTGGEGRARTRVRHRRDGRRAAAHQASRRLGPCRRRLRPPAGVARRRARPREGRQHRRCRDRRVVRARGRRA